LITKVPSNIKVVWIGWGFDYFRFWDLKDYKPITQKLVGDPVRTILIKKRNIFLKELEIPVPDEKFLSRVDYFSPVLDVEFHIFKKFFPNLKFEFLDWNYLTLEDDIIKGFEEKFVNGNNLLFGNSALPLNNHLDGIDLIINFNFDYDQILCPLSYGDKTNRNETIIKGNKIFGNNFIPITDFLDYNEYVNNLISCKYFFVNSLRQVAMGNIVLMLYLGSKVILDKSNPVYEFFITRGVQVFSIEEANTGQLPSIDLENTRSKLKEIWGRTAILEKTKSLLEAISK
jgi:hypothetical protein